MNIYPIFFVMASIGGWLGGSAVLIYARLLLGGLRGPDRAHKQYRQLSAPILAFYCVGTLLLGSMGAAIGVDLLPGVVFAEFLWAAALFGCAASSALCSSICDTWASFDGGRDDFHKDDEDDAPEPDPCNWDSFDQERSTWKAPSLV